MNEYRDMDNLCCYFHPTEVVVGVCPFCLNERLLVLAHGHHHANYKLYNNIKNKKPLHLPKIFAFGGSLLNRLELKQYWKSHDHNSDDHDDDHDASISQEDSFISIKFEDNGAASWEKSKSKSKSKVSLDHCSVINSSYINNNPIKHKDQVNNINVNKDQKLPKNMVIEHAKQQSTLRWRKRIGHLFHVMRWKKSSKTNNTCHVGSKVGWIKTLTKRNYN